MKAIICIVIIFCFEFCSLKDSDIEILKNAGSLVAAILTSKFIFQKKNILETFGIAFISLIFFLAGMYLYSGKYYKPSDSFSKDCNTKEDSLNSNSTDKINSGILQFTNGEYFEGQHKNGKPEGKGVYFFTDGRKYEGEFRQGEFNGSGVLYYPNEDRYEGQFKDGRLNGIGIYYFANGNRYEGEFKEGIADGKGFYYFFEGRMQEGETRNGRFVKSAEREYPYNNTANQKTYIDVNGYRRFKDSGKLVHRWVAEKKLGRRLDAEEIVHHIDCNKLNNSPDNLFVFPNQREHHRFHQENPEVCGHYL